MELAAGGELDFFLLGVDYVIGELDLPRAEPMLKAERANVENCILTLF